MTSDLLALLDLQAVTPDHFRGTAPTTGRRRVFGGLVVAQALVAVSRTVAERTPHSLHAYFVLPGDPTLPIDYEVERVRDGRSFTTRRCRAVQKGRTIFDLAASFQLAEGGLDHQAAMPDLPGPEANPARTAAMLAALPSNLRRWFEIEGAVEVRPVDADRFDGTPHDRQRVWMRARDRLPDDPAIHRAVLAYLSDLTLIDASLAAHGRSLFEPDFTVASLDHALWFHRDARADEWLLYAQDSPNTSGGRGFARGQLFTSDGRLVASVAQEGLIRLRREP